MIGYPRGIVVATNTGLGDQIIMNGAVRYLAECYDQVWFVTWENRKKHAEFLYKDRPNIEIYTKPSIKSAKQGVLRMESAYNEIVEANPEYEIQPYKRCFWTYQHHWAKFAEEAGLADNVIFPRIFYNIIGVPYERRYRHQKIPRDFKRESELFQRLDINEKFVFLCNDSRSSKYNIQPKTDKRIINPADFPWMKDTLIYDWQTVMQLADEIHTVNTCWFHLARTLQLKVPKYYYPARNVLFCEQNDEFLNDNHDNGWTLLEGQWKHTNKRQWWLL